MHYSTTMRIMYHLFLCRMPDPDFNVNDVKMFVGKTPHRQQCYLRMNRLLFDFPCLTI